MLSPNPPSPNHTDQYAVVKCDISLVTLLQCWAKFVMGVEPRIRPVSNHVFLFYVPNLPSWRFTLASEGLATNNYPGLFKSQLDRLPNLKPEFLYLVVDDFGLNYRSIFAPQPH